MTTELPDAKYHNLPPKPLALVSSAGLGPLYAKRDHMAQGEHYTRHVSALTGEGLWLKSEIAAELAHRDMEIERLRAALHALLKCPSGQYCDAYPEAEKMARDALGPNVPVEAGQTACRLTSPRTGC